jgi:molybdopterin converting factor small subunit
MGVNIEISSIFARYAGGQTGFQAEGKTVGDCLNDLGRRYPELGKMILTPDGRLLNSIDVFINGESAYPGQLARPLKDGDRLKIIMIIQGG